MGGITLKKNFYQDLYNAQTSEVIVVDYLTRNGYYVEDVRHLKNYQVRSIDYVALANQQAFTIEVKDDARGHETGNFIIELEAGDGKPGWFKKCQATTLAIVSQQERLIYLLSMRELKQYIRRHRSKLREVTVRDYNEDGSYESFKCVLINRAEYERQGSVIKIDY